MPPTRTDGTLESLFPYASNFTINGGTFISARRYTALQQPRRRKAVRLTGPVSLPVRTFLPLPGFSSTGIYNQIVKDETIFLVKQILCGDGYRIHAAHMQGRAVIVKVFDGRQAWKDWDESATSSRNFMHPNFVRVMGCSSRTSPDPYLVYHGGEDLTRNVHRGAWLIIVTEVEDSAERMLASVLREELSRCLVLGLTMVYGIASALGYLTDKEYLLETAESMDFDILVGGSGHVQMCMKADAMHPSSSDDKPTNMEPDHTLTLFDDLCRRISIVLPGDEVERSAASHPDLPSLPPSLPNWLATATTTYPPDHRLGSAGRRELVWKTSDRSSNLNKIAQQVEAFLFRVRTASAGGHVQRYPAREQKWVHHRCPGYRREEILLGTQAQCSVILFHSTPSSQEMCTVCGETVENVGWFRCSCRRQGYGIMFNAHATIVLSAVGSCIYVQYTTATISTRTMRLYVHAGGRFGGRTNLLFTWSTVGRRSPRAWDARRPAYQCRLGTESASRRCLKFPLAAGRSLGDSWTFYMLWPDPHTRIDCNLDSEVLEVKSKLIFDGNQRSGLRVIYDSRNSPS
ncbi:hypothetical protein FB451DRAFT_1369770 [Mycena latifolia]|nr:hypothetical protein FB451DRAFT_1369770 [Mycena latifolia]